MLSSSPTLKSVFRFSIIFMWTQRALSFVHFSSKPTSSSRIIGLRPFLLSSTARFSSTIDDVAESSSSGASNNKSVGLPRVLLKRNRVSKSFRDGSQLVFAGSVAKAPKSLQLADLVQVEVPVSADKANKDTVVVGWGVYNPESMYRVRILSHSLLHPHLKREMKESAADSALATILSMQFQKALQIRKGLGLPSAGTDTYRLVNGEGDGISGLAVDIIGDRVAVVMSSAAWCEIHKSIILSSLQGSLPDHELIWKNTPSRLRQDGFELPEEDDEAVESSEPIVALENGIQYQTFPHQKGQKTSVYCDQRENRFNLSKLCKGKRVLDLCCYHGGFSLNAAKEEATTVIGVDSSQDAVEVCRTNAELNQLADKVDFVKADISDFMQSCDQSFDVIVLDPPKLAPSVSGLSRATRKYHSLNRDALKLMDDAGGIFMTCTCSAAMTQKEGGNYFLQMVQQASLSAKREVTLLRMHGAAPCHTQSPVR
jgi:23S rRNA G2069 N7-methylase RlmK/C1962 C5-methylase RlmI